MTTSGFGKVILLGEHAVVYGYPALAGAVALRVAARVAPATTSSLVVPAWQLSASEGDGGAVANALEALVAASCPDGEHWRILVSATLPSRAGLGSSAALSVAITRALAKAHDDELTLADIETRAAAGERCFHDTPSGVDVAVASRGGLGLFRKDTGLEPIGAEPIEIVVGLTGEPRDTRELVGRVAAARERDPKATDANLARLGELAETAAKNCRAADRTEQLGGFFREAQTILAELGVSSPGIDEMVDAAHEAGAIGAKLTGAGGGGAVIAVGAVGAVGADGGKDNQAIAAAWQRLGREAFITHVGVATEKS